jgi:hypothetical protein
LLDLKPQKIVQLTNHAHLKLLLHLHRKIMGLDDGNQGAGHADHTHGNGAEVAQDPLSLPSGPITRLRAKCFKEALNGLIQENWANSKKTKMGSNNNQGLVHVIKAIEEDN